MIQSKHVGKYQKSEGLIKKRSTRLTPKIYPKIFSEKYLTAFSEEEKQQTLQKYKS